jgi:two-component system sensor histidine kinase HydH
MTALALSTREDSGLAVEVPSVGAVKRTVPPAVTQRERELAAIISSYNEVTERLKAAHERLCAEVARLRDELRRKNEELRRSERLAALGQMAAGLAHEVRNPLGGIALYASMLERDLAGQPSAGTAAKIFHGVRSLESLVCEILDFAQEDRLERRLCVLGKILRALEDQVAAIAQAAGVSVTLEPSAFEVELFCDPERLQRVLSNLVINAVQAAGSCGWARLAAEGVAGGIRIEVTDNGAGIPEEDWERVFDPFFTTKASGTGLGLAICHRIVEAHGGTIRVGRGPAGGARFVVWIPSEVTNGAAERD